MKRVSFASYVFSIVLGALLSTSALAEQEVEFVLPRTTISDFPGETVNLPSLSYTQAVTDVSIPGPPNMALEFKRRSFTVSPSGPLPRQGAHFGGAVWAIDLPVIGVSRSFGGQGTNESLGCIGNVLSFKFYMGDGNTLQPVGFGSASDLPSGTIAAFESGEAFLCENNVPVVKTPDGRKITFGEQVAENNNGDSYYVTSIADRFGNSITYNWSNLSAGGTTHRVLSSISRNDGALVQINRAGVGGVASPYVTSVSAHGRVTNYAYTFLPASGQAPGFYYLSSATDPENRVTQYETSRYSLFHPYLRKVTLPSGGNATYTVGLAYGGFALGGKVIAGPEMSTRTIAYQKYQPGVSPNASDENRVIETETDYQGGEDLVNTYTFRYIFGGLANYNAGLMAVNGRLDLLETKLGSALLYKRENSWTTITHGTVACRGSVGALTLYRNCARPLLTNTYHHVYNSGGTDVFETDPISYDKYGYVLTQRVETDTGASRYEKYSYVHDKTNWLLGLPSINYVSDDNSTWHQTERVTYHSATGSYKSLPNYFYSHGRWYKRNDLYHSNGELRRTKYNGITRFEQYDNYKRGIPQTVKMRNRYSSATDTMTRVVDNFGNITQETDFEGNTTSFAYDDVDRMTSRNYADPVWSDVAYYYNDTLRYSYETRGTFRTTSWWDGIGREYRVREEDTAAPSTRIHILKEFDKGGRVVFESHPSTSSSPTSGTTYSYDGLGRRTASSIAATGTNRQWSYLSGNRVQYTDARSKVTTTTFQAYGEPSYELPTLISSPESVTTTISYTLFDLPDTVSQGGITKNYVYDSYRQLC